MWETRLIFKKSCFQGKTGPKKQKQNPPPPARIEPPAPAPAPVPVPAPEPKVIVRDRSDSIAKLQKSLEKLEKV